MKRAIVMMFVAGCASSPTTTATPTPTATATPTTTATTTATATATATPTATDSATPTPPPPPTSTGPGNVSIGEISAPANYDPKPLLKDALPKMRDCYADALKASPKLEGRMMVRFAVNETGKVTSVDEEKSTTKDPGLFACIKGVVSGIAFPKPPGTATVTMPLRFKQ